MTAWIPARSRAGTVYTRMYEMDNRTIHYHKEIRRLFDDPSQRGVFRIDEQTVGVTDGPLSKAILAARPMYDFERIVFKPILASRSPRRRSRP